MDSGDEVGVDWEGKKAMMSEFGEMNLSRVERTLPSTVESTNPITVAAAAVDATKLPIIKKRILRSKKYNA